MLARWSAAGAIWECASHTHCNVSPAFPRTLRSLGRLLGGLAAEAPPQIGSQLDAMMPPPPARTRAGSKRGASAPAESSLSNGSGGGSRGGRAGKRPLNEDGAGSGGSSGRAAPVRRSGRGRAADLQQAPHLEMSQQVSCVVWSCSAHQLFHSISPVESSVQVGCQGQVCCRHMSATKSWQPGPLPPRHVPSSPLQTRRWATLTARTIRQSACPPAPPRCPTTSC